MEMLGVWAVCCAAYLAGCVPLDNGVKWLSEKSIWPGGIRIDQFARTSINIFKGFAVVFFAGNFGLIAGQCAALFVFLGHNFPFQRSFQGRNGMALLLGTMIALHPLLGLVALFSWLFTYFVYRYAGLSAVMSALVTTTCCHYVGLEVSMSLMILLTAIVVWRHRDGLGRVAAGTEEMVVWD